MRNRLLSAPEVARITNLGTDTVRAMAKRGELPGAIFIGHHLRFDPDKLKEFFESGGSKQRDTAVRGKQQ